MSFPSLGDLGYLLGDYTPEEAQVPDRNQPPGYYSRQPPCYYSRSTPQPSAPNVVQRNRFGQLPIQRPPPGQVPQEPQLSQLEQDLLYDGSTVPVNTTFFPENDFTLQVPQEPQLSQLEPHLLDDGSTVPVNTTFFPENDFSLQVPQRPQLSQLEPDFLDDGSTVPVNITFFPEKDCTLRVITDSLNVGRALSSRVACSPKLLIEKLDVNSERNLWLQAGKFGSVALSKIVGRSYLVFEQNASAQNFIAICDKVTDPICGILPTYTFGIIEENKRIKVSVTTWEKDSSCWGCDPCHSPPLVIHVQGLNHKVTAKGLAILVQTCFGKVERVEIEVDGKEYTTGNATIYFKDESAFRRALTYTTWELVMKSTTLIVKVVGGEGEDGGERRMVRSRNLDYQEWGGRQAESRPMVPEVHQQQVARAADPTPNKRRVAHNDLLLGYATRCQGRDNLLKVETDFSLTVSLYEDYCRDPKVSTQVFVGGIPRNFTTDWLTRWFQIGDWPINIEQVGLNTTFPNYADNTIKRGYVYIIYGCSSQVDELLRRCLIEGNKFFYQVPVNETQNIKLQVIPWRLADSVYNSPQPTNKELTVFVGGLHGTITARGLAVLMTEAFGEVKHSRIDTNHHLYPIGSGEVTFVHKKDYISALESSFLIVKTPYFEKKLQVEPYLAYSPCSACNERATLTFCKSKQCLKYLCDICWDGAHIDCTKEGHTAATLKKPNDCSAAAYRKLNKMAELQTLPNNR